MPEPTAPKGPEPGTGASRVEHDTMGEIRVPIDALWGAQTQRARENFTISGLTMDAGLIAALALIKGAAAAVNARLGVIPADVAEAIVAASSEVAEGRWSGEFPLDVFQTGSGTSTNMNVNEVIANLASRRLQRAVHANDHVNASQSSNDVFPSAIHLAAASAMVRHLMPSLGNLALALRNKAAEFFTVVKAGRTHLMDATPVTLGQELGGYASAIEHGMARCRQAVAALGELPLGGTAVGTGINAPVGFASEVIARLGMESGLTLSEAADHFEAQGGRDALVDASARLRTIALSMLKVANDLRWMASGPQAGLGEIRLPDLQPGSSIMPGKVNPVVPEAVWQVAAQVVGNDAAVGFAATASLFELNLAMPVMAHNVLQSIRLLSGAARALSERCVAGIEADEARCRRYAESSPALATALVPHLGYEAAADVVRQALAQGRTVREMVVELELLPAEVAAEVLDVEAMARGGIMAWEPPI